MDAADAPATASITVRLEAATRKRVRSIAAREHRSVSGYLQMLIERDLQARDEAERVVHVFVAPELADEPPGTLSREEDENDERYEQRAEALRSLLGGRKAP